jgi:PKD repeat protein
MKVLLTRLPLAMALAAVATACTVHQTEAPDLTGPSEFALSIRLEASPDSITQDGGSQSVVRVIARGPDGEAVRNQAFRLDMFVNGQIADYGTLSGRTVVTGSDGIATAVYTAPPAPPVNANSVTCAPSSIAVPVPGNCVTIGATPIGSGFGGAHTGSVDIHLMPIGVILPPAGAPTASFFYSPTAPSTGQSVNFDGSASQPGTNATITQYSWVFGDGSTNSGVRPSHAFTIPGTYNVSLTVTNDRGLSATTTNTVSVISGRPTATFTFTVDAPTRTVAVDGGGSTAVGGATIVNYTWNWGDGASTNSGGVSAQTHTYGAAGTYPVTLTITDSAGQTATSSKNVTIP